MNTSCDVSEKRRIGFKYSGIRDFAFTLCVGFTIGIYSTVFVASALVVDLRRSQAAPVKIKLAAKKAL